MSATLAPVATGTANAASLTLAGIQLAADDTLIVGVVSTGYVVSAVAWGASALTQLGQDNFEDTIVSLWYLAHASAGTHDVVITLAGDAEVAAVAAKSTGLATTPLDKTAATTFEAETGPTTGVTATTTWAWELWVGAIGFNSPFPDPAPWVAGFLPVDQAVGTALSLLMGGKIVSAKDAAFGALEMSDPVNGAGVIATFRIPLSVGSPQEVVTAVRPQPTFVLSAAAEVVSPGNLPLQAVAPETAVLAQSTAFPVVVRPDTPEYSDQNINTGFQGIQVGPATGSFDVYAPTMQDIGAVGTAGGIKIKVYGFHRFAFLSGKLGQYPDSMSFIFTTPAGAGSAAFLSGSPFGVGVVGSNSTFAESVLIPTQADGSPWDQAAINALTNVGVRVNYTLDAAHYCTLYLGEIWVELFGPQDTGVPIIFEGNAGGAKPTVEVETPHPSGVSEAIAIKLQVGGPIRTTQTRRP
jgi:hypothetical protein